MVTIDAATWCDPCIEPLVRALNAAGLRTIASCCGHGTHPTSVVLDDDRFVVVVDRATYEQMEAGASKGDEQERREPTNGSVEA